MATGIIHAILSADVNSLQSSDAKECKAALEQTLSEVGGKLEDFKVTKGTVTFTVDTKEAFDQLVGELESQGYKTEKVRPLAAFKGRQTLKHSDDEAKTPDKK